MTEDSVPYRGQLDSLRVVDPQAAGHREVIEVDLSHDRELSWLQAGREGRLRDRDSALAQGDDELDARIAKFEAALEKRDGSSNRTTSTHASD